MISYDHYHIMGCPEWEDAVINGEISNQFQPDWTSINLNGFIRPKWFAQGWWFDCVDYLIKKRSNANTDLAWRRLEVASHLANPEFGFLLWETFRRLFFRAYFILARSPSDAYSIIRAGFLRRIGKYLSDIATILVMILVWSVANSVIRMSGKNTQNVDGYEGRIVDLWKKVFPERADVLTLTDVRRVFFYPHWRSLFGHYDIVLAYSTDPIIPLIAGVPYFAFEHGTIRDIPYKNDAEGRCTAIAYREAEHIFVTNFDCLASAEMLAPGKFTLINHPYDEDHGLAVKGHEELRHDLQNQLGIHHIFFSPTRQDWVPGTGYADKANDIFLLALGDLKRAGASVGAVCCEWGKNVAQSKELIEREGLTDCILWVKPLANIDFERMSMACDMVVDQFKLGAFGGVLFKAMAVGSPILTYLNESRLLEQYPEIPPVVNCKTREEIIEKVTALFRNPERLRKLGTDSRMWIKKHHSKDSTVNLQVTEFRRFLTRQ